MKKVSFIVTVLLLCTFGVNAQVKVGTYSDWEKTIDELEVKEAYDFSGRKTVVILPVETSEVEIPKKSDDNYKLVTSTLANMTQKVANQMKAELSDKGYKVIVAESADYRDPDAIVIQLNWQILDLGSRALRAWVGFGAGNAKFSTAGVLYDGDKEVINFTHQRVAALDAGKYEKLMDKGVNNLVSDIAKMITKL